MFKKLSLYRNYLLFLISIALLLLLISKITTMYQAKNIYISLFQFIVMGIEVGILSFKFKIIRYIDAYLYKSKIYFINMIFILIKGYIRKSVREGDIYEYN